ncbi:MAG: formylglycine-generating enzyme family protein [Planctomycetales bacterium]|nr:formylglycine-generating enzyme family protein [Planctomycetales bacterium]
MFTIVLLMATPACAIEPGDVVVNTIGMKLAYVPPGKYTMGSPAAERDRVANETQSTVTFKSGFRIGVTEVTQKQWREVMGTDPSFFQGDELPVEQITWQEANKFCKRLSEKEHKRYRLPTMKEWEYACRAGTTTVYSSGNDAAALAKAGWYLGNSDNQSHAVGQKQPNAWGLYDMHGNVSEWCALAAKERSDSNSAQLDDEEKALRDLRGGSWGLNAPDCRSASIHANAGTFRYFDLGMRVVCELD